MLDTAKQCDFPELGGLKPGIERRLRSSGLLSMAVRGYGGRRTTLM